MREIELMFNRCRFQSVMDVAEEAKKRTDDKAPFFSLLRDIAEGFYCWDSVQYDSAYNVLKKSVGKMPALLQFADNRAFVSFSQQVNSCFERLTLIKAQRDQLKVNKGKKNIQSADPLCRDFLADIVANAIRRAEVEHKYDDAVARLYSAIEKMAKITLKADFNFDNSAIDVDSVTDEMIKTWLEAQRYGAEKLIKLPLSRSFELLFLLQHPLGKQFKEQQQQLEKVLSIRNGTILAHGYDSVSEKTYGEMLKIALLFLGLDRSNLPVFPQMSWGYQGLS
ncbi:MAG: CRISPR-associated protein [Desulfobacteraceae bacterium 4572_35.1]|nr:MAG: CRISPR-associated protein [Desulfobacteraceae bacterium 4572_35.1]